MNKTRSGMTESPTFFCDIKGQDNGMDDETKSSGRSTGCTIINDIATDCITDQIPA